ncbi:hypothetical protein [Promicromonospora sp. NPDC023987]|uniref:hypothetical protein n=1 Tax=Promicromonospora sp. NPDC023987 TaxID=3155360 RepID=UPI0033EB771C
MTEVDDLPGATVDVLLANRAPSPALITIPADEEIWGIRVTDSNGDEWTWRGLGNRGRLPSDRNG